MRGDVKAASFLHRRVFFRAAFMLPRINRARTHVHASETRNTVCCSVESSFYSTFVGFFSQFFTLELQNSELNEEHGDTDRHVHRTESQSAH